MEGWVLGGSREFQYILQRHLVFSRLEKYYFRRWRGHKHKQEKPAGFYFHDKNSLAKCQKFGQPPFFIGCEVLNVHGSGNNPFLFL